MAVLIRGRDGLASLHVDRIAQRIAQFDRRHEHPGLQPRFIERRKISHRGQDRVRCRLTEAAAAHACHRAGERVDGLDVTLRRSAGNDLLHLPREQRRADATGRAPATRLVDEEAGELQRDVEYIAVLPENHGGSAGR